MRSIESDTAAPVTPTSPTRLTPCGHPVLPANTLTCVHSPRITSRSHVMVIPGCAHTAPPGATSVPPLRGRQREGGHTRAHTMAQLAQHERGEQEGHASHGKRHQFACHSYPREALQTPMRACTRARARPQCAPARARAHRLHARSHARMLAHHPCFTANICRRRSCARPYAHLTLAMLLALKLAHASPQRTSADHRVPVARSTRAISPYPRPSLADGALMWSLGAIVASPEVALADSRHEA